MHVKHCGCAVCCMRITVARLVGRRLVALYSLCSNIGYHGGRHRVTFKGGDSVVRVAVGIGI